MRGDGENLEALFRWALGQITPVPKRVGRPKGKGKTVWATGDAVLEGLGAINWETREYIWEETDGLLREVATVRRRTVIGDAEHLAATSIVLAWSRADTLLLLGTDNRNVLACTRKGYSKKAHRSP